MKDRNTLLVVTVKRKADDVQPDLKSLFPENMRVMVNAMSASIQAAKKEASGQLEVAWDQACEEEIESHCHMLATAWLRYRLLA